MILKIDHLAFGSGSFDQDVRRFESLGYTTKFKERGLRDLDNKRGLMRKFGGELDMALLHREGSIDIEVLNHGHVVREPSYLLPILEGTTAGGVRTGDALKSNGSVFARVKTETEEFFVEEPATASEFRCHKVVVDVDDISCAIQFWGCFGFKPTEVDERVAVLQFRPFLAGRTVVMYARKHARLASHPCLDSHGFNCIAFFSSDAQKDHKRFTETGMKPTEINEFRVNNKALTIFWVQGPQGEVAEVIGLATSR